MCKTFFIPKKIRKSKPYCLKEMFVLIMLLSKKESYALIPSIDEKGNEHIVQFGFEGWWITDLSSYLTGANSIYRSN
jgi:hypothetical protein